MIETDNLCLKKKVPEISKLNLHIENGESYVLLSSADRAVDHFVDIFSGVEQRYTGSVKIDNVDMAIDPEECRKRLIYLSSRSQWPPEMKAGHIISFFKKWAAASNRDHGMSDDELEELYIKLNLDAILKKKISELENVAWRRIIFSLARLKRSGNYIFHDFCKGMPLDFNLEFKKSLSLMKKSGCSILYLSDDVFLAPEIGDRIGFMKKGKLLLELKASKMKKMELKELYFQFLAEK